MTRSPACLALTLAWLSLPASARGDLRDDFSNPPLAYNTRPLWFWNAPPSKDQTRIIMQKCRDSGYYGFGILPTEKMGLPFMGPQFLDRYQEAVDAAAELGLKMCLYDEFWFPSGSAGGLLAQQHPEALGKRLDLLTIDIAGPQAFDAELPSGTLMAAVAMHRETKERLDLTGRARDGRLAWNSPPGPWQVLVFTCVSDGARGLVDYLDPDAVRKFIGLTYQKYYDKFPQHFGRTIDSAFYDEPTFHWTQGGRAWTPSFNARFQERYGRSPALLYPALWLDIGPETAAARNALFGLRAEMFATGFAKTINDWCREHKIVLTGHVDQEEVVNPVGLCGDLMKSFQYQDMPGIDQIFQYGRASKAYKVVSSAATNYGQRIVMCECYGAINNMPVANLYKEAMDQFAKGINLFVPHAVWYDAEHPMFPPELSYRSPVYGPELPAYNRYLGRLQRILQHGQHVADIGVLYPIATLQAGYRFGVGTPYTGGSIPTEADYMTVGDRLMLDARHDFTFVHPEVLDERGTVEDALLRLDKTRQHYRVFLLPGSTTICRSTLQKIKAFYERGGQVIATTRLPDHSAEFGEDGTVQQLVREMFGPVDTVTAAFPKLTASSAWAAGGHDAEQAADEDADTRWNAKDGTTGDQWLEVDFGSPKTFHKTFVHEAFDRTTSYKIQSWDGSQWQDCASGTKLGASRTDTFPPVTAARMRLYVNSVVARDSVSIVELAVYDAQGANLAAKPTRFTKHAHAAGGAAWFTSAPTAAALKAILAEALPVPDVAWEQDPRVTGGNLSYCHKVLDGREVFFFANSSETAVEPHVRLRGRMQLEWWDPQTGKISTPEFTHATDRGQPVTRVKLTLPPVRSCFLIGTAAR
jgi:hypothetical protein